MNSHILNIQEAKFHDWGHGEKYQARIAWLGIEMGSNKLGFNVTEIAPGKRAFPCHSHATNEELFFILEGAGRIRIGTDLHDIKTGDFINLPPDPGRPHQIVNTGAVPLKFIAVSTMIIPEISVYPDSGKYGVFAGAPTGKPMTPDTVRKFYRIDSDVDYWEGED